MNLKIEIDCKSFLSDINSLIDDVENIVDDELKKTSYKIQRTARQLAPIDSGELRRSIVVNRVGKLQYEVGSNLEYAHYMEDGTSPHVIMGNPFLYWKGANHPVDYVIHPGTKAYEYMQKSFDMHIEGLEERINKAISSKF